MGNNRKVKVRRPDTVPTGPVKGYGGEEYSSIRDSETRLNPSPRGQYSVPVTPRPANRSARRGTTRPKTPPQKTYTTKGLINQNAGSAREGQSYAEFTVKGRSGVWHEYVDPVTGKKTVVRVGK